VIICFKTFS